MHEDRLSAVFGYSLFHGYGGGSIIRGGACHELRQLLLENEQFYFVHSYYAQVSEQTIGFADYQISYSAALANKNFLGVQFHPERSGKAGEQLLTNFLKLS